jgi:MFS family permease
MAGMPLPVIPIHVHHVLGFGPLAVGILVGAQFASSLLTRPWSGVIADAHGPKRAVVTGFAIAIAAGAMYLVSLTLLDRPSASFAVLLLGRLLLGCAESLVATGALAWGIARVGVARAGTMMVWVGNAIFGAMALGAPIGGALYAWHGLAAVGMAAIVMPVAALVILRSVAGSPAATGRRASFLAVARTVWLPGLGLALTSTGFGAITAFVALLFVARSWDGPALAFTAFGIAFIVARVLFGRLPDRQGGARVALWVVAVGAAGQFLIWQAGAPWVAYAGAALTGFGYSLAFPAFGVEAVRRAPPESRGTAMGAYVLFLDLALGLTGPAAGVIAGFAGFGAVYLATGCTMLLAILVAWRLLREDRTR